MARLGLKIAIRILGVVYAIAPLLGSGEISGSMYTGWQELQY